MLGQRSRCTGDRGLGPVHQPVQREAGLVRAAAALRRWIAGPDFFRVVEERAQLVVDVPDDAAQSQHGHSTERTQTTGEVQSELNQRPSAFDIRTGHGGHSTQSQHGHSTVEAIALRELAVVVR